MRYLISSLLCLFLAACGGTTVKVVPVPTPPTTGPVAAQDMRAAALALIADHTNPVNYTSLSAVPVSGQARFDGYAYGTLANTADAITDTLIGDLSMQVTFNASSVSVTGQIDELIGDDGALTGSLSFGNATLDRDGNPSADATLRVALTGAITDDNGAVLNVGALLEGDFLGNTDAVGGAFLGRVTVGGTPQDIDGGFIAAK